MAAEAPTLGPPSLDCFVLEPDAPEMRPAEAARGWMDATHQRFANRCIPLSIANASGWELLCPAAFTATWRGGDALDALTIFAGPDDESRVTRFAASHFGHGILTFHTGYLMRTPPGWAVWARGTPNTAKPPLTPLDGLVETDWLPMPFTMNWRFTRPGTVRFEAGEAFCFITLTPHGALDAVTPRLRALDSDPELAGAYQSWSESRATFNARLASGDAEAQAQGWQKHYVRGEGPGGEGASGYHLSKRRLKAPVRS